MYDNIDRYRGYSDSLSRTLRYLGMEVQVSGSMLTFTHRSRVNGRTEKFMVVVNQDFYYELIRCLNRAGVYDYSFIPTLIHDLEKFGITTDCIKPNVATLPTKEKEVPKESPNLLLLLN